MEQIEKSTIKTREITSKLIWAIISEGVLNQKQIAEKLKIHHVNLSKYKTKVATPSAENLLQIINLAEITIGAKKVHDIIQCV